MHIKGCQKRVIVLSSPECEWIEQAYFILKENTELPPPAEKDMVKVVGRQYAAHAVTASGRFCNIAKPSGT